MNIEKLDINQNFLSYIVNGDRSGLTKKEIKEINEFIQGNGIIDVSVPDDDPSFTICDVTGEYAICFECDCLIKG